MSKALNAVTTLLTVVIVILAVLIAGVRVFGFQTFPVLTESMEPKYPRGALIYVKEEDPFRLKSGDIITYMVRQEELATKRITAVIPDASDASVIRFQVKAETDSEPDSTLVLDRNVIGVSVFVIPVLGYVADYIQNPPGIYVAVAVCLLLLVCLFLPDLLKKKDREKQPAQNGGNRSGKKSGKYEGKFTK